MKKALATELALTAVEHLSPTDHMHDAPLWMAPITNQPRYWLAGLHFAPHAVFGSSVFTAVEHYENGSHETPPYVRAYLPPEESRVWCYILGQVETISRLSRYDKKAHQEAKKDEPWFQALSAMINVHKLFGNVAPHFFMRECTFVIDHIGLVQAQSLRKTLRVKRYVSQLPHVKTKQDVSDTTASRGRSPEREYFAHITSENERQSIPHLHYGLVVTNSKTYKDRNRHYHWQEVG